MSADSSYVLKGFYLSSIDGFRELKIDNFVL